MAFVPTDLGSDLVEWLKGDVAAYIDAGVTLATNGQTLQQWNDQSSGGHNASQATSGSRPSLATNDLNGLASVVFNGNPRWMGLGTLLPASSPYTIVAVVNFVSTAVANDFLFFNNVTGYWLNTTAFPQHFPDTLASPTAITAGTPVILVMRYDSSTNVAQQQIWQDGVLTLEGDMSGDTTDVATYLGAYAGSVSNNNFKLSEMFVAKRALTIAEIANAVAYENSRYALSGVTSWGGTKQVIMFEGDSITYGTGVSSPGTTTPGDASYPAQVMNLLGNYTKYASYNHGVGGSTFGVYTGTGGGNIQQASRQVADDLTLGPNAPRSVFLIWSGTNDIFSGGLTAAQVETVTQQYILRRRSYGWQKFIDFTILPRADHSGDAGDTQRLALNTWKRANWASYCDALIDAANISQLTDPTNATYYADGIHPNTAGNAALAAVVEPVLAGLLLPVGKQTQQMIL